MNAQHLSRLTNLRCLTLERSVGDVIGQLTGLTALTMSHLGQKKRGVDRTAAIGLLKELQRLEFHGILCGPCDVTKSELKRLSGLHKLSFLDVGLTYTCGSLKWITGKYMSSLHCVRFTPRTAYIKRAVTLHRRPEYDVLFGYWD